MTQYFSLFISIFISSSVLLNSYLSISFAENVETTKSINRDVTTEELIEGIQKNRSKVFEFEKIREIAERLGVRVWLFGGTASTFAHYVKWDLERLKGDTKYQKEHFGYNYVQIYRSTQDMDIVIDGKEEKALELQIILQKKFPYFLGNTEDWEVRLLREKMGDKEPLLKSFEFLNQHTDSHSTGLIELTNGFLKKEENINSKSIVKDLRDWDSKKPKFLRDVTDGKLTYYYSESHNQTQRYKDGQNPEIFSVIRYFTKLFQYELKPRKEDLEKLQKIIDDFSKKKLETNYAKYWVEKNGKKLIFHSTDVEYSLNVLEDVGLRERLIELGKKQKVDSLSWWLNKEPLRTNPISKNNKRNRTAKKMGIEIVTHETSDLKAYEIITKSKKGKPNVFISRENTAGETAAYGDGFYTMVKEGWGVRNTGLSIRFKVHPDAKESKDFKTDGDIVLVKNKAILEVITEDLNIGFKEYFEMLEDKNIDWDKEQGLLEQLKRKINNETFNKSIENKDIEYILNKIKNFSIKNNTYLFMREWFNLEISKNYPELVKFLIRYGDREYLKAVPDIFTLSHWKDRPELVKDLKYLIKNKRSDLLIPVEIARYILSQINLKKNSEWIEFLTQKGDGETLSAIGEIVLSKPNWKEHPELVEALIKKGNQSVLENIARYVLSKSHWKEHPELVEALIQKGGSDVQGNIAEYVLSQPHWKEHPELVEALIQKGDQFVLEKIAEYVLSKSHWKEHPELVEALIQKGNQVILEHIAEYVLSKSHFKEHPEWVEALIQKGYSAVRRNLAKYVLWKYHWKEHPELVEALIQKGGRSVLRNIAKYVLPNPWHEHPELLLESLIKKGGQAVQRDIAKYVLSKSNWKDHPELVEALIAKGNQRVLENIVRYVLSQPHFKDHPELVEALIAKGNQRVLEKIVRYVLSQPHFKDHPEWVEALIKKGDRYILEEIFRNILSKPKWKKHHGLVENLIENGNLAIRRKIARAILYQPYFQDHSQWTKAFREKASGLVFMFIFKLIHFKSYFIKAKKENQRLNWGIIEHMSFKPQFKDYPELIEALIKKGDQPVLRYIAHSALSHPKFKERLEWLEILIKKGNQSVLRYTARYVLSQSHWKEHPELVEALIQKGSQFVLESIARYVLSQSHWKSHPELVESLIQKGSQFVLESIARYVLSQSHWKEHPELVEALVKKGNQSVLRYTARYVLYQSHFKDHPELVEALIKKGNQSVLIDIAKSVLSKPYFKDHPELVKKLIEKNEPVTLVSMGRSTLSQPHWRDHIFLRKLLNGKEPTVALIKKAIENGHWDKEYEKYKKDQILSNKPSFKKETSLPETNSKMCVSVFL